MAAPWFAGVLRAAFALAVGGVSASFAEIGADGLRGLLSGCSLDRPVEEAAEHVMTGFTGLDVHPDVYAGIPRLAHGCDRTGAPYPSYFRAPDLTATGLDDQARQLA